MFENFMENISKWNVIVGLVIVLIAFALLVAAKPLARKFLLGKNKNQNSAAQEEEEQQPFPPAAPASKTGDQFAGKEEAAAFVRRESHSGGVFGGDGVDLEEETEEALAAERERRKKFERKITREQADKITGFALVCKIVAAALAVTGCILVMFV